MTMELPAAVLDTNVFSLVFVSEFSRPDGRVAGWRDLLRGMDIVISFQTRAEVLVGALQQGWGSRRMTKLGDLLDGTLTISMDMEVLDAFVNLTVGCRTVGHALHGKDHTGDRWIAACAIAKGLPLLSGDGIYEDAPLSELLDA